MTKETFYEKNLIVLALASFISPLQAMPYDFADDSSSEDDYLMEIEAVKSFLILTIRML